MTFGAGILHQNKRRSSFPLKIPFNQDEKTISSLANLTYDDAPPSEATSGGTP